MTAWGNGIEKKKRTIGRRRVAFYVRVSTHDRQTLENQKRELRAAAKAFRWDVVQIFQDKVSGSGKKLRPGYEELLKAIRRRNIDMIAAWSVDRLSRSTRELIALLDEMHARGVDLYLHNSGLDTSTPGGRALFQMYGVFAELEREQIRERIMAGLARTIADGTKLGRPRIPEAKEAEIIAFASANPRVGIGSLAKHFKVGVSVIQRVKAKKTA